LYFTLLLTARCRREFSLAAHIGRHYCSRIRGPEFQRARSPCAERLEMPAPLRSFPEIIGTSPSCTASHHEPIALRDGRFCRLRHLGQSTPTGVCPPHAVNHRKKIACHHDLDFIRMMRVAQPIESSFECGILATPDRVLREQHRDEAQIRVPVLAQPAVAAVLAGLIDTRIEPDIGNRFVGAGKPLDVADLRA